MAVSDGMWFCGPAYKEPGSLVFNGYFIPPYLIPRRFDVRVNGVSRGVERRHGSHGLLLHVFKRFNLEPYFESFAFSLRLSASVQSALIELARIMHSGLAGVA